MAFSIKRHTNDCFNLKINWFPQSRCNSNYFNSKIKVTFLKTEKFFFSIFHFYLKNLKYLQTFLNLLRFPVQKIFHITSGLHGYAGIHASLALKSQNAEKKFFSSRKRKETKNRRKKEKHFFFDFFRFFDFAKVSQKFWKLFKTDFNFSKIFNFRRTSYMIGMIFQACQCPETPF